MKYSIMTALATYLMLVVAPISASGSEISKVRLGDSPWPPYTLGEVGQQATGGIGIEVVREVYRRLGIELSIEMYPWKRVLKMSEVGRIDGPTLLMKNREREKYLVYTIPVFEARELLHYRKDRLNGFDWKEYSDLKGYTIGLVNGYTYGPAFMKAIDEQGLKVEYAVSPKVNFQKLYAGRIDFYLDDDLVARAFFQENENWMKAFTAASNPVSTYAYHMALSKNSPAVALISELNRVIVEMKSDGTLDRLLGRSP